MEAVKLSFIFTWDYGKAEDRAKASMSSLFEESSINNDELRDNSTRTKCMTMRTRLETKRQIQKSEDIYNTRLLENFPLL